MDTSKALVLFWIVHWSWTHKQCLLAQNLRTGNERWDALALTLQQIMHLLNYKPARSFTDCRTTAKFKYIQCLQDQDEQE